MPYISLIFTRYLVTLKFIHLYIYHKILLGMFSTLLVDELHQKIFSADIFGTEGSLASTNKYNDNLLIHFDFVCYKS